MDHQGNKLKRRPREIWNEPRPTTDQRQDMFASHDGAPQFDGGDAVECRLSDLVDWRVSARDANTDIVVEEHRCGPNAALRP